MFVVSRGAYPGRGDNVITQGSNLETLAQERHILGDTTVLIMIYERLGSINPHTWGNPFALAMREHPAPTGVPNI